MAHLDEVHIAPLPFDRFRPLLGDERIREATVLAEATARRLHGRVWWNVNSTARGGGVAEMLQSLLAYARGLEIDTRWLVIEGNPDFFRVTKRLHHALHGSSGDGTPLAGEERAIYDDTVAANGQELLGLVRPGDVVLLHDPQTAGLAPTLIHHGAIVIWRCHVGADARNAETDLGWAFLTPYLGEVAATVFSRRAYVPAGLDGDRAVVIPPSIDAFSPKNQELDEATVRAILVHTGIVEGPPDDAAAIFHREDGSLARVDRQADIVRLGRAPSWERPLVVQVSRWDPLKDPVGVLRGFAELTGGPDPIAADLVLAGPNVSAVTDDPEGATTFNSVVEAWRALPHVSRGRIHLASLPMTDREENAAIVNALQRHAAVVVQKSLKEGFGLTVTEAMWKGRPVIGSAIGGIQDQIDDGVHGLLLPDPTDLTAFAAAVRRLLADPDFASTLGIQGKERVRQEFLGIRHLMQYAALLDRIESAR
ncbi:MAG: glycosyltransferase [Thermomicrobiales bacterium]